MHGIGIRRFLRSQVRGRYELETYLKMMQYGQVTSVLHWQLTENYGVLTGGPGALQPTRRFFHLKQLGMTPGGAAFVPLKGDAANISHAAYGDAGRRGRGWRCIW